MTAAPFLVRAWNPVTARLLRIGLPLGPNVLMTVRGRTSGQPRTLPVAIPEIHGRRFVIGAYGEVHWVRNLRAAGEADVEANGRTEHVRAIELDRAAAVDFYARLLPGFVAKLPWFGRLFAAILFRLAAPEIANDPERAAAMRPVFEILRA